MSTTGLRRCYGFVLRFDDPQRCVSDVGGARDVFAWVFDPAGLIDTDGDGVLDSAPDNCPTVPN